MTAIPAPTLPLPTDSQRRWQDLELGMFFHFDICVYAPEWNWRSWQGCPSPAVYNPTRLDTDQWLAAAQAMGAKYAVFVAKHCSGFCQWQTDVYPYGLRQSPWQHGKGDLVGDFVDSCRRAGILPGIYASVSANAFLGVDNPGLVNRGRGGDPARQAAYARTCEQMLTELWSRYGELFEVWFDGGARLPEDGGPDLVPLLQRHQPQAVVFQGPAASIRWIGNEQGVAPYPCWATVPAETGDYRGGGDPDGQRWLPGECDVPVRNHDWFWRPGREDRLYSVDELLDMYDRSVGRNCNLLLNANPGPDGLVPEADFQRYVEFGRAVRARYANACAWTAGQGSLVELELPNPTRLRDAVIMEDIAHGEHVRRYRLQGMHPDGTWLPLAEGQSIGHKRLHHLTPVPLQRLRLEVSDAVATPQIREFSVYSVD